MSLALDSLMSLSPVIPVLVIEEEAHAAPLARALAAGGVRALEVTLRTPAALAAIRGAVTGQSKVYLKGDSIELPMPALLSWGSRER
jgi:2-keto-3-deoxy-6-phosphogluconate aldolase